MIAGPKQSQYMIFDQNIHYGPKITRKILEGREIIHD